MVGLLADANTPEHTIIRLAVPEAWVDIWNTWENEENLDIIDYWNLYQNGVLISNEGTQSIRTEGTQVLIFEQLYLHMEIWKVSRWFRYTRRAVNTWMSRSHRTNHKVTDTDSRKAHHPAGVSLSALRPYRYTHPKRKLMEPKPLPSSILWWKRQGQIMWMCITI